MRHGETGKPPATTSRQLQRLNPRRVGEPDREGCHDCQQGDHVATSFRLQIRHGCAARLGDDAGEVGPVRIQSERVSDNRGREETTHLLHKRCAYFRLRVECCEPLFEQGDEIARPTLVVADFQRNKVCREDP
jgi:hypothetical protein